MNILVYLCDRNLGIFRSDGQRRSEPPFLDFLLEGEGIKCFCNIDFDMANLAALVLNPPEMVTLAKAERVWLRDTGMTGYGITYFPDKMVAITKYGNNDKVEHTFCDLAQYSEWLKTSPERDAAMCEAWVEAAGRIANDVYATYVKLGFHPESLISAPNVFRHERLEKMDLPSVADEAIPIEAMEIAHECCKGGWTDVFTLGHFKRAFDYDLRSAYPAQTAQLLDIRRGTWLQSADYQPQATYGYCRCEVNTDAPFHPILHDVGNMTLAGNGVYETSLTKAEIDFINKWQLGFVTILDGWWWTPNATPQHELFKGVVKFLYDRKEASTGLEREIAKRMLNGTFYGLFLQLTGPEKTKPGQFYMPCYGAEIQANTRLRVADACLSNGIIPLHVAVDGFVSPKKLNIEGEGLGSWKLSHSGAALVVGTMLWAIQGKQGDGDFSVSYDWLLDQIKSNPKAESYSKSTNTVLTLGRAVAEHREQEVGSIVKVERAVNVTDTDLKRCFEDLPLCGGDIIKRRWKSVPWDEELIRGEEALKL